jgi:8-oxo-dGTP pyrophosphatase MutT (NUDIX family)
MTRLKDLDSVMFSTNRYAARPYRYGRHGIMQIMVLTSRSSGRWVIPKGWPMASRKPHQVAAIEAHQEGGIKGVVERKPAGIKTGDALNRTVAPAFTATFSPVFGFRADRFGVSLTVNVPKLRKVKPPVVTISALMASMISAVR